MVYNIDRKSTINYPPFDPIGISKDCGLRFKVDWNDIRSYKGCLDVNCTGKFDLFSSNVPDDGNNPNSLYTGGA